MFGKFQQVGGMDADESPIEPRMAHRGRLRPYNTMVGTNILESLSFETWSKEECSLCHLPTAIFISPF